MVSIDTADEPELDDPFAAELESITETIIGPIVRRSLRTTLNIDDTRTRNQDALELVGDIQVMIIAAAAGQNVNGSGPIRDLRGYAAKTAANACYLYFRTHFPERTRQDNKLRYALRHMDEASIWKADDGRWLCSLSERFDPTRAEPVPIPPSIPATWAAMETREGYIDAVRSVLEGTRGPVLFDELVDLIMETLGIRETSFVSIEDGQNAELADIRFENPTNVLAKHAESTAHLKRLWRELVQMKLEYRKVLLLNLKYRGSDLVRVLPLCGVATTCEIAEVLGFTDDEFAEVLRTLPWDDRQIADHLGITRQQVINLRRNVRSRLFRIKAR